MTEVSSAVIDPAKIIEKIDDALSVCDQVDEFFLICADRGQAPERYDNRPKLEALRLMCEASTAATITLPDVQFILAIVNSRSFIAARLEHAKRQVSA